MTTGNVIASMFRERDSHAVYLLEKQGITRFDVINYISHGVVKVETGGGPIVPRTRGVEDDGEDDEKIANPLESFCVDLTQRAREGKIDPLIGRADELERMIQVLCAAAEEQPAADRRARRRQDRARRGPRAAHRREARSPRSLEDAQGLLARHDRGARGHALSRRLRGAPQGRDEGPDRRSEVDPVHRRDPQHHRRRRDERRHDGRGEHPQAAAVERRAALHRLDDVQGLSPGVRARSRAVAPVPAHRHRRADGRPRRSRS